MLTRKGGHHSDDRDADSDAIQPLLTMVGNGNVNGHDTPIQPLQSDDAYKRKRVTLRSAEEGQSAAGSSGVDEDEWEEEEELKGWPTKEQLIRRIKISWTMLRFGTVIKILAGMIITIFILRMLLERVEDHSKSSHFSIVALLRDMSSETAQQDRWQFAFQWSALMSWSAILLGRNILVFVDTDDTCTFLEEHVRGIQCFVIPPDTCFHPEYKKPRLDCIFSVAHEHAPTDTIVYINADVLIGPDLSDAIRVVQAKHPHFVLSGRRTDLAVTTEMLEEFRAPNFVQKLIHTAQYAGHLHKPDAIDLIVYQKSEFLRKSAFQPFPPFLAAAPYWEGWFLSQAILDEKVASIDLTPSVMLVHLDRGKVVRTTRVGAPYNEDLVRKLSGNNWKVGMNMDNLDFALQGDCTKGEAQVADSSTTTAPGDANAIAISNSAPRTGGEIVPLTPGCYIIPNPNVTDLVLFTKRASKEGFLTIVSVNSAYLPLALNWLCWVERVQFAHYVFLAEDRHSWQYLKDKGVPVLIQPNAPQALKQARKGSIEWSTLVIARSDFLGTILNAGFHFLYTDLDTIWLEDPLRYLDTRVDLQGQARYLDSTLIDELDPSISNAANAAQEYTGSLLAVRATTYGRYFWNKVIECQKVGLEDAQTRGLTAESAWSLLTQTGSQPEARCINSVASVLKQQPLFTATFLDQFLFPDGQIFFQEHKPQLRGVIPVVIHNNDFAYDTQSGKISSTNSIEEKLRRLKDWELNSVNLDEFAIANAPHASLADTCIQPDLLVRPVEFSTMSKPEFQLKIRVLTYNRPVSLSRLLKSLAEADWLGSTSITLEISIDHPIPTPEEEDVQKWSEVVVLAQEFQWNFGEKKVIEQQHNIGLVGQWTRGWFPSLDNNNEVCLFLEDDISVTPEFFKWLKPAIEKYYLDKENFDPRLFGISLQRQHTILGETHLIRYGSRTPSDLLNKLGSRGGKSNHLYKYQLLGTWGAVFFPGPWRKFLSWLDERGVDTIQGTAPGGNFGEGLNTPCVPTLLSNKWWQMNPHKTWTQWFIRFAYEKGWYSLYTNFPDQGALVLNHREPGLNFNMAKGSMHQPVGTLTEQHLSFPPTSDLPIFDFHFNLVTHPDVLSFRKSLTNEKFLTVSNAKPGNVNTEQNQQCWTLDQLVAQLKRESENRRNKLAEERAKAEAAAHEAAAVAQLEALSHDHSVSASTTTGTKKPAGAAGAKKDAPKDDKGATTPTTIPAATPATPDPAAAKGREWDDHVHAPGEKIKLRKEELTLMAKLPDNFINSFFDPKVPDTIRHLKYLSGINPVFSTFPKSSFLTVSDGRFGMIAAYIKEKMDKDSTVTASELVDPTLLVAKDKLKKITKFSKIDPAKMSLADNSVDFIVSLEAFPHYESPMDVVKEMMRVAKKGIVVIEPHDTPLEGEGVVKDYPETLKKNLVPFAGKQGIGTGERADLNLLVNYARGNKFHPFVKVFRDNGEVELAKKQIAAGAKPWAVASTVIFKKALTPKQKETFIKGGYAAL